MNILIPDSWLREYLKTDATPKDIQRCLSLCGPSVERVNRINKDWVYDIEVTTNRVDCMSVLGIAREAKAILPQFGFKVELSNPKINLPKISSDSKLKIINNPSLCHRLLALHVSNVRVSPSPENISQKLESVGVRSLNNLIDITNYVMWETGHPVHVFDLNRIHTGKMVIRVAKAGEKITTLDEKTHTLLGKEVIIDDGVGNIIDLPSIMGTANSVVTDSTTEALFFIDDINAAKVRFTSMSHGIRTQAATLMEKGVDPDLGNLAISRIIDMIKILLPNAKIVSLTDIYPHPVLPKPVTLSLSQIKNNIGIDFSPDQINSILDPLGFLTEFKSHTISVTPPSFRAQDICIPEDVIEEIARIFGYHNLPTASLPGPIPKFISDPIFKWETKIKTALKYLGFNEVYTYSLVDKDSGLKIKNPLSSEWTYLRTSIIPSHLKVITENSGRFLHINLFEIANVYIPRKNDLPQEQLRLVISTTDPDYYRFKGIVETLFSDLGLSRFSIRIDSESGVLYFEESLDLILKNATLIKTFAPISKFTPIFEDINVTHDHPYDQIVLAIKKISSLISNVELIDKYQNKLTLRLTFHSDTKQLSAGDIEPIRSKLTSIII